MVLLYSNKTKDDDILLYNELDYYSGMNPNFRVHHTLTRHDDTTHGEWQGLRGRVTEEMIKECRFPEPSDETLILFCGPPGFMKTCEEILEKLGYDKNMRIKL